MQPLGPPEKVALYQISQPARQNVDVEIHYAQVAINPERWFKFFIDIKPSFWPEFICIWSPQAFVSMKYLT